MSQNAIIGHPDQTGFLLVSEDYDEVAVLLAGTERGSEWDELPLADRQRAVAEAATEIDALRWRGDTLFAHQAWALPTDAVPGPTASITAGEGSSPTRIVVSEGVSLDLGRLVHGAVHKLDGNGRWRDAARIVAVDVDAWALTLAPALADEPAGESLVLVGPLPSDVRRAIAIQAVLQATGCDQHELGNQVHQGRTSSSGQPGTAFTLRNVGGGALWHVDAYNLVARHLRRGLRMERE